MENQEAESGAKMGESLGRESEYLSRRGTLGGTWEGESSER